ncbi:hypothetical protein E2C01_016686 [Portunus trituberculatus]|uniref:Uncharacterized protein n=1 Tax=Portunus trituberculatus TaxID=210409 RepID=A0A5B7DRV2_PORTR|nr:hypothetical protein [Portunus trituberculatus]
MFEGRGDSVGEGKSLGCEENAEVTSPPTLSIVVLPQPLLSPHSPSLFPHPRHPSQFPPSPPSASFTCRSPRTVTPLLEALMYGNGERDGKGGEGGDCWLTLWTGARRGSTSDVYCFCCRPVLLRPCLSHPLAAPLPRVPPQPGPARWPWVVWASMRSCIPPDCCSADDTYTNHRPRLHLDNPTWTVQSRHYLAVSSRGPSTLDNDTCNSARRDSHVVEAVMGRRGGVYGVA